MNGQLFYRDENGEYKPLLPITEIVDLSEHESKTSQTNDPNEIFYKGRVAE